MSAPKRFDILKPELSARRDQLIKARKEKCQQLMENFNKDMINGVSSWGGFAR